MEAPGITVGTGLVELWYCCDVRATAHERGEDSDGDDDGSVAIAKSCGLRKF